MDLNESLEGEGELVVAVRERWEREEAWVGTLTLLGRWETMSKFWIKERTVWGGFY